MNGAQKTDDRCRAEVWDNFRTYQCSRKAVKDGYCKQHHPDTVAERDAKNHAAWEEKRKKQPWYVINELKRELEAARKEIEGLKEIAIRAGAWQDKNGTWVYGNDKVTCHVEDCPSEGSTVVLNATADKLTPSNRKHYTFVEKGPGR